VIFLTNIKLIKQLLLKHLTKQKQFPV